MKVFSWSPPEQKIRNTVKSVVHTARAACLAEHIACMRQLAHVSRRRDKKRLLMLQHDVASEKWLGYCTTVELSGVMSTSHETVVHVFSDAILIYNFLAAASPLLLLMHHPVLFCFRCRLGNSVNVLCNSRDGTPSRRHNSRYLPVVVRV